MSKVVFVKNKQAAHMTLARRWLISRDSQHIMIKMYLVWLSIGKDTVQLVERTSSRYEHVHLVFGITDPVTPW